jgi:hypothetical protein
MESQDTHDKAEVTQQPAPFDDCLLTIAQTAKKLGLTYRSLSQARVEGRVLLEEVKISDGKRGRPMYRLSDVNEVIAGRRKALRSATMSAEEKAAAHARTAELRAQRKAARDAE